MNKLIFPNPPAQKPNTHTLHGVSWNDPYAWLKADNWQEVLHAPSKLPDKIRTYLETENAHTQAFLSPLQPLVDELYAEMKSRVAEADASVPVAHGQWEYFSRYVAGGQHKQVCRIPRNHGRGEATDSKHLQLLIDGNTLAKGQPYLALSEAEPSPGHTLLAYTTDTSGSEFYTLQIRDIVGETLLEDSIPHTDGSIVWQPNGQGLYYIKMDDNHRPNGVWHHTLGTPASSDVCVFDEADKGLFLNIFSGADGRYLILKIGAHTTSELHVMDMHDTSSTFRCMVPRTADVLYDGTMHPQHGFIAKTNAQGAEDFALLILPENTWGSAHAWQTAIPLLPHTQGRMIENHVVLSDYVVAEVWDNALATVQVIPLNGSAPHSIDFTDEAYDVSLVGEAEFTRSSIRFSYSSFTTPAEVYDYNLTTRERVLRKRQNIPSGHNPSDYITKRLSINAPAGAGSNGTVQIPVTLLAKKSTLQNGPAPCWLNGYGSYGITYAPAFDSKLLSLADRGWVVARAHIRGGSERGRRWYLDGKLDKKQNTFTDFIAVAEGLVAQGITAHGNLVANGASAGGMLMGAVANMAPEGLFAGIVAGVPFVDVLTTMLDDTLPLTPPEWPEWGNPRTSKAAFETIRAYSPVNNVQTGRKYPALFVHCGVTDPRVTYWEPAKWIATLREKAPAGNYYLLTNMDSGHFGSGARFDYLREYARNYAFALTQVKG